MSKISEKFSLFPLTADERTTCQAIVQPQTATLTVMPTHHIDEFGNFMGFRFSCDPYIIGSHLPITRTMFHGTTMVQCDVTEEFILQLMSKPAENQTKMREFLAKVEAECIPATLDCVPENTGSHTKSGVIQASGNRTVDSKPWTPELPSRIGIYHAYIRGYNRDVRTHRLFIICSGGLLKACDEFCNLVIDVGSQWTAKDVMISEEAWWLKKACQRARCRLIKSLADHFHIPINHMQDIMAYDKCFMAIHTTDTLEHDMGMLSNGKLAVYNMCIDTTRNMNGMLCNMHPSEGVWLFKGAHRSACFGSMYGDHLTCGVFPVNTPRIKRPESILVQDAACVIRHHTKKCKEHYMCFDESYFKLLEIMQWNRDNGVEQLIPIIVGIE